MEGSGSVPLKRIRIPDPEVKHETDPDPQHNLHSMSIRTDKNNLEVKLYLYCIIIIRHSHSRMRGNIGKRKIFRDSFFTEFIDIFYASDPYFACLFLIIICLSEILCLI